MHPRDELAESIITCRKHGGKVIRLKNKDGSCYAFKFFWSDEMCFLKEFQTQVIYK